MLIDLHIHSHFSQKGVLDPDEIILRAKHSGLDGVCFTEDQPFPQWREIKRAGEDHEIVALVGLEIFTTHGHFLAFLPDPQLVEPHKVFPPFDPEHLLTPEETLQRTHEAGGALVAAHPYDLRIPAPLGDRLFQMQGLRAIEVRNGKRPPLINDFALEASENLKLPAVGGSDIRESLEGLGLTATLFRRPIANEAELIEALTPGETWSVEISSNPNQFSRQSSPPNDRRDDRRDHRDHRRDDRRDDRRRPRRY